MGLTKQQQQASSQKSIQTDRKKMQQNKAARVQAQGMMQPVRTTKRALQAQRALQDNQEEEKSSKRSKSKNSEEYTPAEATFFEPAQARMEVTMQQLSALFEDASDEAYWNIGQSLTSGLALDAMDFLQNDPVQKDAAGFLHLLGEFNKIAQAPADTWKDSLLPLVEEFRKVNATGEAMSNTYLKDLQQQSPYAMFLYVQHCFLTAAQDAVDQLKLTAAQQEQFAQIYSTAMASGMIVGRMNMVRMQNEIKVERELKKAAEEEAKKAAEEEAKKVAEEEAKKAAERAAQMLKAAAFREGAPNCLNEHFAPVFKQSSKSFGSEDLNAWIQWAMEIWEETAPGNYNLDEFSKYALEKSFVLSWNIAQLELSSQDDKNRDLFLGINKNHLPQLLLHQLGKQVLSEKLDKNSALISDACTALSEKFKPERELYQKRLNYLCTRSCLKEFGSILNSWVTENVLILDMEETEFEKFAEQLNVHAGHNFSYVSKLFHQNLCAPSARAAIEELKLDQKIVHTLLTGTPSAVSILILPKIIHLNQYFSTAYKLQEQFLRSSLEKKINPRFYQAANRFIDDQLYDKDNPLEGKVTVKSIEACLTLFQANMEANAILLEQERTQRKLTASSWRALADWEKESIGMKPSDFQQKLHEFIADVDAAGTPETRISYRQFGETLSTQPVSESKIPVSLAQEAIDLFMGEDVCDAPVLAGLLVSHADTVLLITDNLMEQNRIPGCGSARCVADLANIPVTEYLAVTKHMRTALMQVIYAWTFTNCPEEKKNALLKRILPDLMEQNLSEGELQSKAKAAMEDIENLERTQRIRFLEQVNQPGRITTKPQYLNWDIDLNKSDPRIERRLNRSRTAYEKINMLNYTEREMVLDYLANIPSLTESEKEHAKKIIAKKRISEVEKEFLISGYEEALFRHPKLKRSFIHDSNNAYNENLQSWGEIIRKREKDLKAHLDNHRIEFQKQQSYFHQFHDMIAGLNDVSAKELTQTPEHEAVTYNLNHFGVKSWDDAMSQFAISLSSSSSNVISQKDEQALARAHARLEQISTRENGLYVPILRALSDIPEVWQTLCLADETGFADFMKRLDQQYLDPLVYVQRRYSTFSFVKQKLLVRLFPKMQEKPVSSEWDYQNDIDNLYKQIMDEKHGSHTLNEEIALFIKKVKKIPSLKAKSLTLLLLEGEDILYDDAKLEEYKNRVTENQETLRTFAVEKQLTPKDTTDFFKFGEQAIVSLSPNDFQTQLPSLFENWKMENVNLTASVKAARQVMAQRSHVLMQLEESKREGEAAFEPDRIQLERLKNTRSLLIDDDIPYNKEKMSAARKELTENKPRLSPFILTCLTELSLKDKQPNFTALRALGEKAQAIYETMRNEPHKKVMQSEETARRFVVYLLAKHTEQLAQGTDTNDALLEFQRASALITAIMELKTDDPFITAQRNETANALSAGIYRMAANEFTTLAERRLSYLKASISATQIWKEEIQDIDEKQKPFFLLGLRKHFQKDLISKSDDPELMKFVRAETKNLLSQKLGREFLNDSSLLGAHAFDDLTAEELRPEDVKTRADFEKSILLLKHKPLTQFYQSLDMNTRRLFALSLVPKELYHTLLPSMQFSLTPSIQRSQTVSLRAQTQIFTQGGDVTTDIDYSSALSTLFKANGELDEESFNQAQAFTKMCIARRQEMLPIDVSILRDSANTIQQAVRIKGDEKALPKTMSNVHSPEQFVQHLRKAGATDESGASELEQLSKLEINELNLLILALQDRTMMDYTTKVSFLQKATGTYVDFVSPQERETFFETYLESSNIPVASSQELRHALESLYSYQLRDDVLLTKSKLQESDFIGLDRQTRIDWNLLSSAIDFVKSITREQLRLKAIQGTAQYIETHGNPETQKLYKKLQYKFLEGPNVIPATDNDIKNLLISEAKSDEEQMTLSGILSMTDQQRSLFIKALGHRDILDISKADIWLNRFGQAERNYANPAGRNELIDEYLYYCQGTSSLKLETSDYRKAILGMLSSQLDDTKDFRKEKNLADSLSQRETALDWKLIQRAVQLVYRTTNEKEIYEEDLAMYASQGDIIRHGAFHFESKFMRDNIHNAGNRFTRFLGRRVTERAMDVIPSAATTGLKYMALAFLPPKYSNFFAEKPEAVSETSSLVDTLREGVGSAADTASSFLESNTNRLKKIFSEDKVTAASEIMDEVSGKIELFNAAISIGQNLGTLVSLQPMINEAMKIYIARQQKDENSSENTTKSQIEQAASRGIQNNMHLQHIAFDKISENLQSGLINDTIALITNLTSDSIPEPTQKLVGAALEEAGHLINFIRGYFEDEENIRKFFEHRPDAQVLRDTLEKNGLTLKNTPDNISLIRTARGFENNDEVISFVVFNVVRSLLFCASAYNPDPSSRILAVMALHILKMDDAIGRHDSETARAVYNVISGKEYR